MAAVTTYTTYNDVRAVLGASIYELPDDVLALKVFENALGLILSSVSGTLSPDTEERTLEGHYEYLDDLGSLTDDQAKMVYTIELFATYAVADQLAGSISMSMPKTQADGKSVLTRFSSEATFKVVQTSIKNVLSQLLVEIKELLGIASTDISYLTVVPPDVDLITGV